jgi:hypothetical protein
MLVSQEPENGLPRRQGRRRATLAELRHRLANPSSLGDGHRQRLRELTDRLARVQAMGNEYARLEPSEFVRAATDCGAMTA